ncbi:MAG: GDSL-type esterase/lipase family protein [Niameybacter sp.]|uniref:GDSL-type esterase/lipase family protein n=1 Tax=Niameybacter sp. TaxID=2033640 RepID=UPI002FC6F6CE
MKKILFLGDSITYLAQYVNDIDTYLTMHFGDQKPTVINLGLSSETLSGLSEAHHPFLRPCAFQRLERTLDLIKPDLVFASYGMNDGIYHPFSEERFAAYKEGVKKFVECTKEKGCDVVLLTPPPFDEQMLDPSQLQGLDGDDYGFMKPYIGYNDVLKVYSDWLLDSEYKDQVVDIYGPLFEAIQKRRREQPSYRTGDGIHPNHMGNFVCAQAILKQVFHITLQDVPEYVEDESKSELYQLVAAKNRMISDTLLDFIGHGNELLVLSTVGVDCLAEESEKLNKRIKEALERDKLSEKIEEGSFKGHKSYHFYAAGRSCIVVEPKEAKQGRPWVWRTEFFDAFSYADMALLEEGWHIAYCNMQDMYGSELAVQAMHVFYEGVRSKFELAQKADVFGFSRGALYALNYASSYPEHVGTLYLDAPVVDPCSWPGGLYKGEGSPEDWRKCLKIYGIGEEDAVEAFESQREKMIQTLIENKLPLILVAGDADSLVPYDENGAILVDAYQALGGTMKLILKPHVGHHPHSLEDPKEIVDFITKQSE